ncbi:MAG TPA: hypothetical protein VLA64_08085 [Azonexus sp.]|nr:hypothetical protein [Azonexus sp.]
MTRLETVFSSLDRHGMDSSDRVPRPSIRLALFDALPLSISPDTVRFSRLTGMVQFRPFPVYARFNVYGWPQQTRDTKPEAPANQVPPYGMCIAFIEEAV